MLKDVWKLSCAGLVIYGLFFLAVCISRPWYISMLDGRIVYNRHFIWTSEEEVKRGGLDAPAYLIRYASEDWNSRDRELKRTIPPLVLLVLIATTTRLALAVGYLKSACAGIAVVASGMCIFVPTGRDQYGFIWNCVPNLTRLFVQLLSLGFVLLLFVGIARNAKKA